MWARRQREQALRESEERYRRLAATSHPMASWAPSPSTSSMPGAPRCSARPCSPTPSAAETVALDPRHEVRSAPRACFGATPATMEAVLRRLDGRPGRDRGNRRARRRRHRGRFQLVLHDISARKRGGSREILEATSDMVAMWTPDCRTHQPSWPAQCSASRPTPPPSPRGRKRRATPTGRGAGSGGAGSVALRQLARRDGIVGADGRDVRCRRSCSRTGTSMAPWAPFDRVARHHRAQAHRGADPASGTTIRSRACPIVACSRTVSSRR